MRIYRVFIIILLIMMIPSLQNSQSQTSGNYQNVLPVGDFLVGITTNAPVNRDPLNYSYNSLLKVQFDIFDTNQVDIVTSINLTIQNTIIGDRGELEIDLSKTINPSKFYANLTSISIGVSTFQINESNTNDLHHYIPSDTSKISFAFNVVYFSLQTYQVVSLGSITFNNYSPQLFPADSLDFSSWVDFLPFFEVDTIILPLAAIGASFFVLSSTLSFVDDLKNKGKEISDELSSQQDRINIVRGSKEIVEFSSDVHEINEGLRNEHETNVISRVGKLLLALYFILLSIVVLAEILQFSFLDRINQIYVIYTTTVLFFSLLSAILSFIQPMILRQIGKLIPVAHPILAILSISIFVIYPLVFLLQNFSSKVLSGIIVLAYLSFITAGFVLLSLFAGYYLSKSGISWGKLFDKILNKIKIPKSIIKVIIRLFTIAFLTILLLKLAKTISLIIVVFLDNDLSSNAYLVSLAASYLKEEMMGSEFLSYSLILIFFIQTLMAIFLHIRSNELEGDQEKYAVQHVYRRLSLFLLISLLSFLHLIIVLREHLFNLELSSLITLPPQQDTLNVFNLLFIIPPFRLLLDILLAVGLTISLPMSVVKMWNLGSKNPQF